MYIEEIIWLDVIVEKLWRKHGVDTHEVVEALESRPKFRFVEKGHHPEEDLYLALGRTEAGRYLSVFFVYKPDRRALIISAREMKTSERKQYERK
jgi:uncharacterized DUF497 family protein